MTRFRRSLALFAIEGDLNRPTLHTRNTRPWYVIVCALALVHGLATLALSLTRLYTGKSALIDLGFFDQAVWTTLNFGVPTSSLSLNPSLATSNWLGIIFSPIVLVMVPVYAIWASPEALLALQSILVAGSAVLVFRTCLTLLERPSLAFGWTVLYLLNPFLISSAVVDFHEKSVAVFAVALGYLALVEKRVGLFLLSMLILALCREHYGIAIAGFGALWIYTHGYQRIAAIATVAGVLTLFLVFFVVMPALSPEGVHKYLDAESGTRLDRYGWMTLPVPVLVGVVVELTKQAVVYLAVLFATTGGTALLVPVWLLPALADLAANVLSINPMTRALASYHSVALIPAFLIAAAQGSLRLKDRAAPILVCLVPTLVLFYQFAPAPWPGSRNTWQLESLQLSPDPAVAVIRELVPASMSVSVQANVGALFSQRRHVYRFPDRLDQADAVLLQLAMPYDPPTYAPFSNPYDPGEMREVFESMADVIQGPEFGLRFWDNNWLVAVRGAESVIDRGTVGRRLSALVVDYEDSR